MTEKSKAQWSGFLPEGSLVMAKRRPKAKKSISLQTQPVETKIKKNDSLEKILADLQDCKRCKLGKTRNKLVFGEGNPKAKLVFVGEAPGEQEDLQGRPFIGRAGQLLDKMIGAIGLTRADVYICNVVKSRPPENRPPEPDEIEACSPFLFRQLEVLQPVVVVALGKFASQTLLKTETRISDLRGKFFDYRGTKLLPTFHPSYLLRNPSAKKEAWEDFKTIAKELKIKIPKTSLAGKA